MFGRRPDGKKIKGLDGVSRLTPLLMRSREGAVNHITFQTKAGYLDDFIEAKKTEGIVYTYRDITIAVLVRVFRLLPKLNRFLAGGRFYQRNNIDVSMMVHKSLRTGDDETAIKARFTGDETIAEIKKVLDGEIKKAVFSANETDAFSDFLAKLPHWMIKTVVNFLRLFDRLGLASDKFLQTTSPFHCSIFFADLKSICLEPVVRHHLYNFGNCGLFATMSKEKIMPIADQRTKELKAEKILEIGISMDERFADGLYYSHMIRTSHHIFENLSCLERPPKENEIKALKTYKEIKVEKKNKKKEIKIARKRHKKEKKAL